MFKLLTGFFLVVAFGLSSCQKACKTGQCSPGYTCQFGKCEKFVICQKDVECKPNQCCLKIQGTDIAFCSSAPQPGDCCPTNLPEDVPHCPCGGGTSCTSSGLYPGIGQCQ